MSEELKEITVEQQIRELETRIKELDLYNEFLKQTDDRLFDHRKEGHIGLGVGLTDEQYNELVHAVQLWFQTMMNLRQNPSSVFEKIYKSALPVRERMVMAYILGVSIQGFLTTLKVGGK